MQKLQAAPRRPELLTKSTGVNTQGAHDGFIHHAAPSAHLDLVGRRSLTWITDSSLLELPSAVSSALMATIF